MDKEKYLKATAAIDHRNPLVTAFVSNYIDARKSQKDALLHRENAITLYYAVRDRFRYDPYRLQLSVEGLRASTTIDNGYGWCVPKAVLLAACCRAAGIPARLGFGDVKNHLSTKRLRETMKTDIFYWHGYTDIFIDDRWVKATPAFNKELCDKFKLSPLEFDGKSDSVFHPYDQQGNLHMEYIDDRGVFEDLPLQSILADFKIHYGAMLSGIDADFSSEVEEENSGLPNNIC